MPVAAQSQRPLSLAHLSLIGCTPGELVKIAAATGFDLADLRLSPATPDDPAYSRSERMALCRQLLPMLKACGLQIWDVEIMRINAQTHPEDHVPLLEAAAFLGARRVKVVSDSDDPGLCAARLARLAELAAPLTLTLDLEYMVFSGVRSLAAAAAIVQAAGQPNVNVLVDALHWMRAGDDVEAVAAAPPGLLGYVQLCDGPLRGPVGREALIVEARTNRLAPGEGEFPLGPLLEAMPPLCVASIEVPRPPGTEPLAHARRLLQAAGRITQQYQGTRA